ncbi:MAG: glycoside hydrolase family 27 protein [Hydrogeniiclostridium sp.]
MYAKDRVALTPPMGWNSWDCYGPAVNEEQLLANAEYMEKHLKSYGWKYVVCDIQWSEPRAGQEGWDYIPFAPLTLDEYGRQIPAENRFPSSTGGKGFKPIADKIHDMGLLFGIHIMRGVPRLAVHRQLPVLGTDGITCDRIAHPNSVCKWNSDMYGVDYRKPGAQEYYDSIFALYASWGVDFVKVDDIANLEAYPQNPYGAEKEIEMIRHAIDKSGRDMVLSLSPGPAVIEKAWHMRKSANMWRMTGDFWDNWKSLKAMFERCEVWQRQVSPGCWPDCDMLPFGHISITTDGKGHWTYFTREEQRTVMTLWCIFRSPLMMGGEMRDNDQWTLDLLTNEEVLRVLNHTSGGEQIYRTDEKAAWKSVDEDGSVYAALFNIGDEEAEVSVTFEELELSGKKKLRDLWQKADLGDAEEKISAVIPPHGAMLYKLS